MNWEMRKEVAEDMGIKQTNRRYSPENQSMAVSKEKKNGQYCQMTAER